MRLRPDADRGRGCPVRENYGTDPETGHIGDGTDDGSGDAAMHTFPLDWEPVIVS